MTLLQVIFERNEAGFGAIAGASMAKKSNEITAKKTKRIKSNKL